MPFALATESNYDLRMTLGYVPIILTLTFLAINIVLMLVIQVI